MISEGGESERESQVAAASGREREEEEALLSLLFSLARLIGNARGRIFLIRIIATVAARILPSFYVSLSLSFFRFLR